MPISKGGALTPQELKVKAIQDALPPVTSIPKSVPSIPIENPDGTFSVTVGKGVVDTKTGIFTQDKVANILLTKAEILDMVGISITPPPVVIDPTIKITDYLTKKNKI